MAFSWLVSHATWPEMGWRLLSFIQLWQSLPSHPRERRSNYTVRFVAAPTPWDMTASNPDFNRWARLLLVALVFSPLFSLPAPTLWFTYRSAWVFLVWPACSFWTTRRGNANVLRTPFGPSLSRLPNVAWRWACVSVFSSMFHHARFVTLIHERNKFGCQTVSAAGLRSHVSIPLNIVVTTD